MKRKRQTLPAQFSTRLQLIWSGLIVLLIVAAALMFYTSRPAANSTPVPAHLADGKTLYDTYCAACHGFNLEGQADWQQPNPDGSFRAPPHDDTGHTWHHNDAYLLEATKLGGARLPANIGVSAMPAYENVLRDEQIMAILDYIKSSWPHEILEAQQRIPNR